MIIMSKSLQKKLWTSLPILAGAGKSEWAGNYNILERALPSQRRPLSTTASTYRLKHILPFKEDREFETFTVLCRRSANYYMFKYIARSFSVTSNLENDIRQFETKSRLFSTSTHWLAKKANKNKSKTKKLSLDEEEAEGIVDLKSLKSRMDDVLAEMSEELAAKVPLRITSGFMDNILVDTGKARKTPLYELAQVKTNSDSFSIEIQSNFPNVTKLVASAISETGFNLQPSIKGSVITVPIPLFSSDYRGSLEKISKGIANQAKEALRKVRQKGMVDIRNNKEGQSKDLIRRIENQVQQLTNYYNERVDMTYEKKIKEINK